jgi:hypothetical protein
MSIAACSKRAELLHTAHTLLWLCCVLTCAGCSGAGALLYDYEYELDSTRGRKRILNTVTIFDSKLYVSAVGRVQGNSLHWSQALAAGSSLLAQKSEQLRVASML